ncbi:hypothetical protein BRD00_14155 [Halobacteriales archaeon QS_8_69_26]|nr:MAG: hypothetical protein BRD00_14155 [Halobacteriales archaeon QS_8_69_26]
MHRVGGSEDRGFSPVDTDRSATEHGGGGGVGPAEPPSVAYRIVLLSGGRRDPSRKEKKRPEPARPRSLVVASGPRDDRVDLEGGESPVGERAWFRRHCG